jgi:hypothetical protein
MKMRPTMPLLVLVLVAAPLFGNSQTTTYTPMTDAEALSRFSSLEIMSFRAQVSDVLAKQREVIEVFAGEEALRRFDRLTALLETLSESDWARLMATGVDFTDLQRDSFRLQKWAAAIRDESKTDALRTGADSTGFPNASYSTRCGSVRNTPEAMFDAAVVLEGAKTVHAAASRACDQVVAGVNTSLVCIAADVILAAAEGVFNTLQFCDNDIDSAEIEGSYDRLGHLHSDIEGAQTAIINNDNTNKTTIVTNDNANKDAIVNNTNSVQTSIVNNDNANKTAIITNDNTNKTTIVDNDNANKTAIVTNDNTNKTGIITNDDNNREIIISKIGASVTTITGAVDANTTTIVNNATANTTAIVNNDNANKTAIITNDNTNRDLVIANDNSNKSFIVANDNSNRDAILADAAANRERLVQELRALGCDIIRLLNTPEGQRSSDLMACTGQPGFPYAFPEKKTASTSAVLSFPLPAAEVRAMPRRERSVGMETDLAEGRVLPSYYLPAERGGLLESVRDLVWNTIASQTDLRIAPVETAVARTEALKADELLAAHKYVEAYLQYSVAFRQLIPKS